MFAISGPSTPPTALAALGVSAARLERVNQGAATLTLTLDLADSLGADLDAWAWESQWILRRDGVVIFRGRVATVPRSAAAAGERATITLRDAWWDLERTPFTQEWATFDAGGQITAPTSRARLGWSRNGERGTTAAILAEIAAAAATGGTSLALSASLPTLTVPPIEATDQSCAELIRAVLRWHPGAVARIVSSEGGDVLAITERSYAAPISYSVGDRPLAALDVVERTDLVVDSVHLSYEVESTQFTTEASDPDDPTAPAGIRARRRLAIFRDIYPPGAPVTRRSLVATLPGPPLEDGLRVQQPPIPQMVAIKTRALPEDGEYGAVAQKFWLDLLGLRAMGLTAGDIRLPTATVGDIQAHRVRFAWAVNDPDDPLHQAPSALNPNSTPVWRPPDVGDLPRMLVSGALAEWMRVDAAEVIVDCTIAVNKAAVAALDYPERMRFKALNPREGVSSGDPVYFLDAERLVIGTTAKTKVYKNWAGVNSGVPATDTAAALAAARELAVIPNLAANLYAERAAAPWEGSITLTEEEAGETLHLGRVLNLTHPDRPEWADMRAVIQSESLELASGTTTLAFGPPEHLSPQDWVELRMAARRTRTARAEAARVPPQPPEEEDETNETLETPGTGGIFPGVVDPKNTPQVLAAGLLDEGRPWHLSRGTTAGVVKIEVGSILKSTDDVQATLTCTNPTATFTPAAGDILYLEIDELIPTEYALALGAGGWPGGTYRAVDYTGTVAAGTFEFAKRYYPLWEFLATGDRETVEIWDGLHARRLAPMEHLAIVQTLWKSAKGEYVPLPDFAVAHRCVGAL